MGMNGDMDRYLRDRKKPRPSDNWWTNMFSRKQEFPHDEELALQSVEKEIRHGEEHIHEMKHEEELLEEEQEQRVSLYEKLVRMFQREKHHEYAEEIEMPVPDAATTDDFRRLAQIQMRWFERLPTRVKEEFKESEDYKAYKEILTRRGVAKAK
jgi:hypothetical protein